MEGRKVAWWSKADGLWRAYKCPVSLQDDDLDDDSGSEVDPREEGSVADSDASEHEFEEIACTSGGP